MMKVNNLPKDAKKYIVARHDAEWRLWYWDSFEDEDKANEIAMEVFGVVVTNSDHKKKK